MLHHNKDYIHTTYPEMVNGECSYYGSGWAAHVNKMTDRLVNDINNYNEENGTELKLNVRQIKEKFGGLRYHFRVDKSTTEEDEKFVDGLRDYVRCMEFSSYHICEVCSSYGELRDVCWLITLCDRHYVLVKEEHGIEDEDGEEQD